MSKSRKSLSSWQKCEQCQCALTQRDFSLHEKNCPPSTEHWEYCFILDGILYNTKVETLELPELPEQISEREANGMVFVSLPSLQSCDIALGSPVVVETANEIIVQTAWPSNGRSLTSVSLTKHAIELNNITGPVKVYSLPSRVHIAEEIVINQQGKRLVSDQSVELDYILKFYNEHKILTVGNKISVPFYGRKLTYKVVHIRADSTNKKKQKKAVDEQDLSEAVANISLKTDSTKITYYEALYSTKWAIQADTDKSKDTTSVKTYSTEDIGGYDSLVSDIRDVISIGIGKYKGINCLFERFDVNRGIVLHGPTGAGKSMIAQAVISECGVQTFTVCSSNIYSKTINETEDKLKEIFKNAISNTPSIVLFEDIDTVCPRRGGEEEDSRPLERRVLAQVTAFFDSIQRANSDVFVVATATKLDSVSGSLRRPGRLDIEFEIYVPNPNMRREILTKLLAKIPNALSRDDVEKISFDTHGFVGADLYGLCSKAVINAAIRQKDLVASSHDRPKVTMIDLQYALTVTKPSAIKEITVQVPNVKWSDIGGQRELKDLLVKAVVWPLKHPEKFERMNAAPPKGVLMFGPPGCSKTMIAKALATEIRVNFLNIRGPELFSKWVGESEKAVRKVFQMARQVAPAIIFIDEIDALGSERDSSSTTVQERVLAQLLIELDGVTALRNVTLVAATNRPDKIDKALLRPGRFDSIIYVKLPDEQTRREIFEINLRKKPVAEGVDITELVFKTDGYSGAEVQLICNAAAMKALEEDATAITQEHFENALKTVIPRTPTSLLKIYEDFMSKNNK